MNRTLWFSWKIAGFDPRPGLDVGVERVYPDVDAVQLAPNLTASLLEDGRHAPALDLDVPAELIPSSTEGHYHLYIDVPMTWRKYKRLLRALVRAGIVEKGYYYCSKKRGASFLRLPGVPKLESEYRSAKAYR